MSDQQKVQLVFKGSTLEEDEPTRSKTATNTVRGFVAGIEEIQKWFDRYPRHHLQLELVCFVF